MTLGAIKLRSISQNRVFFPYRLSQRLYSIMSRAPIVVPAVTDHTATIIVAHGLGDTGAGWAFLAEQYRQSKAFDHIAFIFPHAPMIPITVNMGMRMPGWYDILSFDDDMISRSEDDIGIKRSRDTLHGIIQDEIKKGIQSDRIVLGGFSQGGAMAINAGLTCEQKLGGIFGLSAYLLQRNAFMTLLPSNNPNEKTKIFMGHGEADPLVKYKWGQLTASFLTANGFDVSFNSYP
jgi:predicted esterase